MMIVLQPTYTLSVEIQDRSEGGSPREFHKDGKTGCDEVLAKVRAALDQAGLRHVRVSLDRFEQRV